MTSLQDKAEKLKEEGNLAFKNGNWNEAVEFYSKAINLVRDSESQNLQVYLKNRAAAYLKLNENEAALRDCNEALKIIPTDPKVLYRRCLALDALNRYEEAYRDVAQIFKDNPTNKEIQPLLEKLHRIMLERTRQNAQISNKIESMMKIVFDISENSDKRITAMNNLLVLSREQAGAQMMVKTSLIQQLKKLLKIEKNVEICVTGLRVIGELCKHSPERTKIILNDVGVCWFIEKIDSNNEEQVNAGEHCVQTILNALSGMENKPDTKPVKELVEQNQKEIDTILSCLVYSVNNTAITGLARDAIIELLMRNVHYTFLNWAEKLLDIGGIGRLLECTSELEEYKYESAMNITSSTRTIAAVCLARIYENMYYDELKKKFIDKIEEFIKDKLLSPDIESKVRVTVAITALLRGPLEVGNTIVGKEGIMEMILVMANSEDELQQKVACECIIAAASKADKAKSIINQGTNILKNLYKSKNDHIRIRALVGLCKLGSSGGTDSSMKPFPEGSMLKLAEACRRFLLHPGKDTDVRKWAAEGLSYLTLDAEVKEKLVDDKAALQALVELAKSGDQSVLFGVITTLVNLCNAYDKQEVIPEMIELAKFAKQHIPQEHELDDPDFVTKRILTLGKADVTTALVALSKTQSCNSRELISRVFNALCSEPELRGIVVAQGGVKVLISMALNGTEKGKWQAAQALARIGITMNPEVAFPGQRTLEVIRPLLSLLHPDCKGLQNFEALMALCNIAQISEQARQRILKEQGFSKIENYMFEDHQLICRAATQCVCNLTQSPDVVKLFEGENDRVKYVVALCLETDKDTALAAAGMLAILTESSPKCCEKLFDSKNWLDCLHCLMGNPDLNMQYRGICIIYNIIRSAKHLAEKLMETNVMEVLMALSKLPPYDGREKVVETAALALQEAVKLGIIKRNDEDNDDDN